MDTKSKANHQTVQAYQTLLEEKRDDILRIAARHGAFNVRVFGSMVPGEARPDSDIDLLVTTGAKTSSWFPARLILDLEALLHRRVEIVTDEGLYPGIRQQVLREAVPL